MVALVIVVVVVGVVLGVVWVVEIVVDVISVVEIVEIVVDFVVVISSHSPTEGSAGPDMETQALSALSSREQTPSRSLKKNTSAPYTGPRS